MKFHKTLFFRTATTLTIALLLLALIFSASTSYFIMVPVAKRSADDLSALLVLAAKTWVELPYETRPDFIQELENGYGIHLTESDQIEEASSNIPILIYLNLLRSSLQERLGMAPKISVSVDKNDKENVWINIPVNNRYIRFGISVERIGARPPKAMISMVIAILIFSLGTALILARRLTKPLEMLSAATSVVGRGEKSLVPEDHATEEVKILAHNFNQMSLEVSELLENRTTLLAGISHDLRTPLTRLRLALEINASSTDSHLQSQLEDNIDEMEQLLDQALQLARGVSNKEKPTPVDIINLLNTLSSQLDAQYQMSQECQDCRVLFEQDDNIGDNLTLTLSEQSLLRILRNLLENALRYGNKQTIIIHLSKTKNDIKIAVLDHGLGIPNDKLKSVFRPFYRLEGSRNQQTGGSGLGLAIVKQLADANHWNVQLLPRKEGGTQAVLTLPISTTSAS